ncbi:Uncharacterized protein, contains PIN domain [Devosia enhydra]|uniref:Ribonuclease VapC n=1 Tax=Devosia enhydra TaxID=665118 RepID=A0A1K2I2E9_9HYPH|nr:type II toxin-antitoxin system VapC family toxin [Devosia enhydra]SFZ86395.1 Uncharacterized protein, contains PIN domain [Devosia enhydra]
MIVVDTSALMAILLEEPGHEDCQDCLLRETEILISSATLTEALIVAERRDLLEELEALVTTLGVTIVALDGAAARRAAQAFATWGKGRHPAGLNFGDCFAYQLAMAQECALLFVGNDFAQTDVASATA